MQFVSLIVNNVSGIMAEDEFIELIPGDILTFGDILRGKGGLLNAWNRYSRQQAEYNCTIKAISDESDADEEYFKTDPDIVRLRLLQYLLHNYSETDYNLARKKIKARLEISGEFAVTPLLSDEDIEKQIKIKSDYVNEKLEDASQTYADNLYLSEIKNTYGRK